MTEAELAAARESATGTAEKLDSMHGDPSKRGSWIDGREMALLALRLLDEITSLRHSNRMAIADLNHVRDVLHATRSSLLGDAWANEGTADAAKRIRAELDAVTAEATILRAQLACVTETLQLLTDALPMLGNQNYASFGPAVDDAPAVQIEIRAAYLASIPKWWDDEQYESESYGALQWHNGGTPGDDNDGGSSAKADDELAGYLACVIAAAKEDSHG